MFYDVYHDHLVEQEKVSNAGLLASLFAAEPMPGPSMQSAEAGMDLQDFLYTVIPTRFCLQDHIYKIIATRLYLQDYILEWYPGNVFGVIVGVEHRSIFSVGFGVHLEWILRAWSLAGEAMQSSAGG